MAWLFAAFAIVWIVIFLYLLSLDRKQKVISAEIDDLKRRLAGSGRD